MLGLDLNGNACLHTCNICLEDDIDPNDFPESGDICFSSQKRNVRFSCGHDYHSECMKEMLAKGKSECPTCRKKLSEYDIQAVNKEFDTTFSQRTSRDVMNDVVNDAVNGDPLSHEERVHLGLWGSDVINTESEEAAQQPADDSLEFGFLDDLLNEFINLGFLAPSTPVFTAQFNEPGINELMDLWISELDFSMPEPAPTSYGTTTTYRPSNHVTTYQLEVIQEPEYLSLDDLLNELEALMLLDSLFSPANSFSYYSYSPVYSYVMPPIYQPMGMSYFPMAIGVY